MIYSCTVFIMLSTHVRSFLLPAMPPHAAADHTIRQVPLREAHRSWTIEANSFSERLLIAKGTKLFVGGKIFGQEEEPAPLPERAKPVGDSGEGEGEGEEAEEDGEGEDHSGDGAEPKPKRRKRRKKYDWSESDWRARAEEQKRLAQEIARKFPDVGQVKVDRMGNIIGGVNPFEGTDVKLEDRPNPDEEEDFPELAGESSGMDDPADSPWRLEAERIIREQVERCGLTCYDILWTFHRLEVTVTRGPDDGPIEDSAYVDSEKLMEAIKRVNNALEEKEDELFVLGRHELIVATPGTKDVLTTSKEFKAFKGFDIIVKTGGPFKNKRELHGKLLERTFDELFINQSGRTVRIPLALVDEVRLPPALVESGDLGI